VTLSFLFYHVDIACFVAISTLHVTKHLLQHLAKGVSQISGSIFESFSHKSSREGSANSGQSAGVVTVVDCKALSSMEHTVSTALSSLQLMSHFISFCIV